VVDLQDDAAAEDAARQAQQQQQQQERERQVGASSIATWLCCLCELQVLLRVYHVVTKTCVEKEERGGSSTRLLLR
jgi:hypothetical protein